MVFHIMTSGEHTSYLINILRFISVSLGRLNAFSILISMESEDYLSGLSVSLVVTGLVRTSVFCTERKTKLSFSKCTDMMLPPL